MMPPVEMHEAATAILEALLIGVLVGAQRESTQDEQQAGLRDFVMIAVTGGICGLLQQPWLTTAALVGISFLLAVFHWRANTRTGITTEMSAVATFCLCVLTATPGGVNSKIAIATTIVAVAFLEAKRTLTRFIRESITEGEFNDTIWFLAIIFIILPILPEGEFGPYEAFSPTKIWLFVILVSSISFVGYFLQKFLGTRQGMFWTSVLGGLASTTAATLAFARQAHEKPEHRTTYWYAAVIANAIQFPRVLVLLYVVNASLAEATVPVLLAMTVAGLVMGAILYRMSSEEVDSDTVSSGNPFRLVPALKFGAMFAVIMFISKAAAVEFGSQGLYLASAAGGAVDADAVAVSVAGLQGAGSIPMITASGVLLLALFMNAILKTALAAYAAGVSFAWRVGGGFLVMFGAGAATLLLTGG